MFKCCRGKNHSVDCRNCGLSALSIAGNSKNLKRDILKLYQALDVRIYRSKEKCNAVMRDFITCEWMFDAKKFKLLFREHIIDVISVFICNIVLYIKIGQTNYILFSLGP